MVTGFDVAAGVELAIGCRLEVANIDLTTAAGVGVDLIIAVIFLF
jgi:hypothetical protein